MTSRLGWYFRAKRLRLGLTAEVLAVRVGYKSVKKGVRRILRLERDGHGSDTLIANLAEALGIDFSTVLDLQERDADPSSLAYQLYRIVSDEPPPPPLTGCTCRR
jgi:transcriptional regulator with XRE-family HTH domain